MDIPIKPGPSVVETQYWHRLDDGRVQCDLCPRHCKMKSGQRGLCFVRGNLDDTVVLTSYGRSSGFCIDPIEKKPLNHYLPGTPVLSFGTAGCNLSCKFCQNWDISKSREVDILSGIASPEALVNAAKHHHARSIAFTYNDPVIFMEYAMDVASLASENQIGTVAVTAGYICESPRKSFFENIQAANIDLKAFSNRFYKSLCGGELKHSLDTIIYVKSQNIWLELTTLLIPEENDSPEEIKNMCRWIIENVGADVPIHFTAFHPDYKMIEHNPTPLSSLLRAREVALDAGLHYVYVGNVHHEQADSTYCHACGECVIERDWYQLKSWQLDSEGRCLNCQQKIPGVFESKPGDWGRKRQTIRV